MSVDEKLVARIRDVLSTHPKVLSTRNDVEEKRMFGGVAFMVRDHMCCGPLENDLMVRVGPDQYESALKFKHASTMEFTGKPLTGFVTVKAEGIRTKRDLTKWIERGLAFVETLPPKPKKKRNAKKR